jgi:hypothetical protein
MDSAAEEVVGATVVTRELPVYHIDLDLYLPIFLIRSFDF